MNLDVNTLCTVTINVEAMLGILLLFAWAQNMALRAVCWWGFAHLVRAASLVLFGLYGSAPDLITLDVSNALLFIAFAATWTGARAFDGRSVQPVYLFAGAVVWLTICQLPVLFEAPELRALIASAIITAYTWLTAYEFWRGRSEQLLSRWPAIFMLFAHGALFLLRTPLIALLPRALSGSGGMYRSAWLDVLSFEALLFSISVAFILLAMAKERTEQRHRTAAMTDPLTGIANRRAFLQGAAAVARQHAADQKPAAVLLMDLDRFKSVNDRFGHAVGDRVLEIFGAIAGQALRPADLFGRLGGEEFAALLYDVSREEARDVAEGLRLGFAAAAGDIDVHPVGATVSIGIAHCDGPVLDIGQLLAQADRALYRAKENGRDRIEFASLGLFVPRRDEPAQPAVAGQSAA